MSGIGGLGRMPAADERDRAFSVAPLLPAAAPARPYRYWWANGWWGNQGAKPHCVEFAWHHFIADGPITHEQDAPLWPVGSVYFEAQRIDEWPGENYDGTSVRAGAKVLQSKGLIQQYRWAFNLQDLIQTVWTISPVVIGTNWYESMFYPGEDGRLRLEGPVVGGHAYLLDGINVTKGLFRIKNSWGRAWGNDGFAYISFDDVNRLVFAEDGEASIALERAF